MLKKTHWFLMQSENNSVLIPQKEENILEAVWMNRKEIEKKVLTDTYASIEELLKTFLVALNTLRKIYSHSAGIYSANSTSLIK